MRQNRGPKTASQLGAPATCPKPRPVARTWQRSPPSVAKHDTAMLPKKILWCLSCPVTYSDVKKTNETSSKVYSSVFELLNFPVTQKKTCKISKNRLAAGIAVFFFGSQVSKVLAKRPPFRSLRAEIILWYSSNNSSTWQGPLCLGRSFNKWDGISTKRLQQWSPFSWRFGWASPKSKSSAFRSSKLKVTPASISHNGRLASPASPSPPAKGVPLWAPHF